MPTANTIQLGIALTNPESLYSWHLQPDVTVFAYPGHNALKSGWQKDPN